MQEVFEHLTATGALPLALRLGVQPFIQFIPELLTAPEHQERILAIMCEVGQMMGYRLEFRPEEA